MIDRIYNSDHKTVDAELVEHMKTLSDHDLARLMKNAISMLNLMAEHAHKRELITAYRIKPQDQSAPKLIVSVMTEVA